MPGAHLTLMPRMNVYPVLPPPAIAAFPREEPGSREAGRAGAGRAGQAGRAGRATVPAAIVSPPLRYALALTG